MQDVRPYLLEAEVLQASSSHHTGKAGAHQGHTESAVVLCDAVVLYEQCQKRREKDCVMFSIITHHNDILYGITSRRPNREIYLLNSLSLLAQAQQKDTQGTCPMGTPCRHPSEADFNNKITQLAVPTAYTDVLRCLIICRYGPRR